MALAVNLDLSFSARISYLLFFSSIPLVLIPSSPPSTNSKQSFTVIHLLSNSFFQSSSSLEFSCLYLLGVLYIPSQLLLPSLSDNFLALDCFASFWYFLHLPSSQGFCLRGGDIGLQRSVPTCLYFTVLCYKSCCLCLLHIVFVMCACRN